MSSRCFAVNHVAEVRDLSTLYIFRIYLFRSHNDYGEVIKAVYPAYEKCILLAYSVITFSSSNDIYNILQVLGSKHLIPSWMSNIYAYTKLRAYLSEIESDGDLRETCVLSFLTRRRVVLKSKEGRGRTLDGWWVGWLVG